MHQTCTGTKKQKKNKNFRGIVAPSQVDCEVFVSFVFFVPVQVWWTLKFKTFVFFVPVQVWCTLNFKTCVFLSLCRFCAFYSLNLLFVLCLWRFGMTHGLLSKCIISQGIGIACLNVMFFHCFCWFPNSGFFKKKLNLIKRHFVFKNRVSFLIKLYILEQGLLHHKRTRPVKGNAIQNRKESRSLFLERRMLLGHSLRCVQTV